MRRPQRSRSRDSRRVWPRSEQSGQFGRNSRVAGRGHVSPHLTLMPALGLVARRSIHNEGREIANTDKKKNAAGTTMLRLLLWSSSFECFERLQRPPQTERASLTQHALTRHNPALRWPRRFGVFLRLDSLAAFAAGVPCIALGEELARLLDDRPERARLWRVKVVRDLAFEIRRRVLARPADKVARQDERALVVQLRRRRSFGCTDLFLKPGLGVTACHQCTSACGGSHRSDSPR